MKAPREYRRYMNRMRSLLGKKNGRISGALLDNPKMERLLKTSKRLANRILILLALLLPVSARACPNLLMGDSLAQGMAAYARADGFEVIARQGAGLSWLRAQAPRCVGRLVVVIGTNDLPGMSETWARSYPSRVAEVVRWWQPERAVWVLPGCFPGRPAMERASVWLDAAAGPPGLPVYRSRPARCVPMPGDGIHPPAAVYRNWWRELRAVSP